MFKKAVVSILFLLWAVPLFSQDIKFLHPYEFFYGGVEYRILFFSADEKGNTIPLKEFKLKSKGIENPKIIRASEWIYILSFSTNRTDSEVSIKLNAILPDGNEAKGEMTLPLITTPLPLQVDVLPSKKKITPKMEEKIDIEVRVRDKDGKAVDAELTGMATRGHLGRFLRKKEGIYQTSYFLPEERYPQIVIISVKAEKGALTGIGYEGMILEGSTLLKGKTKPNSKVIAILGGVEKAGETLSDSNGYFEIPINVGPGINNVYCEVRDQYGNISKKGFPIEIPPSKKIGEIFLFPKRVVSDGKSFSNIFFYISEENGEPLKSPLFTISANYGRIENIKMLKPGFWSATYFPPEDKNMDKINLVYKGEKETEDIEIISNDIPAFLKLEVDKNFLPADGTETANIVASIFSIENRIIEPKGISIFVDGSEISSEVTKEGVKAKIKSPKKLVKKEMLIEAKYKGRGYTLRDKKIIKLGAGKPHKILLIPDKKSVRSGKDEKVKIVAKVMDRGDNPVPETKVEIEATSGKLSLPQSHGDGTYSFEFFPQKTKRVEKSTIKVRAGDAGAELKILVLPKLYKISLGLEVGYIYNFDSISTLYPIFSASMRLPFFTRRFFFGLEAGYFNFSSKKGGTSSSGDFIPLFFKLTYHLPLSEFWGLNFGAGVGGNISNTRLKADEEAERIKEGFIEFSSFLHTGAEFQLGPGRITGGIRYTYSTFSGKEGLLRESGYAGGLSISAGYIFTF
jgi:hypothetical protein